MQTLTIEVEDNFMTEFMKIIDNAKDNIIVKKDGVPLGYNNLEHDSYFYERKKELQKDIDDIDNNKIKMINNEDFWEEIDSFTESLQK